MKVSDLRPNEENPRFITEEKLEKLAQSIRRFPKMMELRPLVIDDEGVILAGNMRFKAILRLGMQEVPEEWVKRASDLTEEEKQEFVIKDNASFGEWDWPSLEANWDLSALEEWGLDVPGGAGEEEGEAEVEKEDIVFSTELDRVSNYIVLKFERDIDFIQAQTLLGLESTYSRRQNRKPWSKGIGRVVDGPEALTRVALSVGEKTPQG